MSEAHVDDLQRRRLDALVGWWARTNGDLPPYPTDPDKADEIESRLFNAWNVLACDQSHPPADRELRAYSNFRRAREGATGEPADAAIREPGKNGVTWIEEGAWDEAAIPPRPWIARGYLLRGAVAVAAGPPSAGKSSAMIAWAVSLVLGIAWGDFQPSQTSACVLIYNVEDDQLEQQRRISATLRQFDATPTDLAGRLIRMGPIDSGILLHIDPQTGELQPTPTCQALEAAIRRLKPDVLMLDPLAELHDGEENDNTLQRHVVAWFRALAARHNMAVIIAHHSRKGSSSSPGDIEILRGASSLGGAARIVLTILVMTDEEAEALGIHPEARNSYFRIDGAKNNYAAIHRATWAERIEHQLANGEGTAAAQPWKPPSVWDNLPVPEANRLLDLIDAGPQPGTDLRYGRSNAGKDNKRWAGQVLTAELDINDKQAAKVLKTWIDKGVLIEVPCLDETRRAAKGLQLVHARRPG